MGLAYDPWREADRLGLTVMERRLRPGRRGEYWHAERRIYLTRGLTYREARSTLAHEVQHALAGDVPSPFGLITKRQELLARRRTAVALIDVAEFAESELLRDGHVPSIAYDLDVTSRVVIDWMSIRSPVPL